MGETVQSITWLVHTAVDGDPVGSETFWPNFGYGDLSVCRSVSRPELRPDPNLEKLRKTHKVLLQRFSVSTVHLIFSFRV